jgi:cell division protein FtsI (penicillin-binding protein 3)
MIDCQGGKITIFGRTIHDNQGEHMGVVPVHKALEESSDVAAVKLAMKIGPDKFYQYIRDFGFGARSGIELPGETRGLLRPVKRWQPSSIGSLAIGQEVAVTPLQLVTMVSTIANGGVYLPPHMLMPDPPAPTDPNQKLAAPQVPSPFRAGGDIPNPLPSGAHRVISTLTAAQMRKMMEGVVLFGTGKQAQLNGYSSGGKTGTAQKIDPATHTYSKTMHIASFAGFAPVNNPVIAVAVIIDTPKGAYYGASVSAPVFAEVAQQVLEYLGVPHDIDMRPASVAAKKAPPVTEDDSAPQGEDIQALFDAANDLPSDDPQNPSAAQKTQPPAPPASSSAQATHNPSFGDTPLQPAAATQSPPQQSAGVQPTTKAILLPDPNQLRVPFLIGLQVRQVIERAGAAGFEVKITGTGTAREQAPVPGTMVAPGTKVVVRCSR